MLLVDVYSSALFTLNGTTSRYSIDDSSRNRILSFSDVHAE